MLKYRLQVNDVIPVGIGRGFLEVIANENGLGCLPPNKEVKEKGNGGYWTVHIPVDNDVDAVAACLVGFKLADIRKCRARQRK